LHASVAALGYKRPVTDARRFDLEDLLIRPGTYFNPQTEILVVVDDSPELDREIFSREEFDGAEWVLVSDEAPLDEAQREEVLERFQVTYQSGAGHLTDEDQDEQDEDEEDDLEPDEDEADTE
jgi:hypothetical protein